VIPLEAISEKTLLMDQECHYSAGHNTTSYSGMLQVGWIMQFSWPRNAITRVGAPVPSVIFIGIKISIKPVAVKTERIVAVCTVGRRV
jgi:hypothetical protein